MSTRNLSEAARRSINAQQSDETWIMLLTLDHPNFTEPARFASDGLIMLPDAGVRGVVSRTNEFVYLPFNVTLPTQDTTTARAQISIDNVDRRIVNYVRQADSALRITMEVILASNPDNVEVEAPDFRLERALYNSLTVSGEISVEYFDLEPFPSGNFTPSQFQGMF